LQSISLEINRGDLVMVIGPVGSGKSSLISAFMNSLSRVRRRFPADDIRATWRC